MFLQVKLVSICNKNNCRAMTKMCLYASYLVYLILKITLFLVEGESESTSCVFKTRLFPQWNYVMGKHYGNPSQWNLQGRTSSLSVNIVCNLQVAPAFLSERASRMRLKYILPSKLTSLHKSGLFIWIWNNVPFYFKTMNYYSFLAL